MRRDLQTGVLLAVGAAGMLAVAALAPGLLRLFGRPKLDARMRFRTKRVLTRLKEKEQIVFVEEGGKTFVRLTPQGEEAFALSSERLKFSVAKPRRWDGQYRLVMFDVPEKRKRTRELIRREMATAGFLRIQDSAWLYPYDCEEYVALLKARARVGKDVLYAVITSIENDQWIKRHFALLKD